MKQLRIFIFSFLVVILSGSCVKKGHEYITFVNNSSREISCQFLKGSALTQADTVYLCKAIPFKISIGGSYEFGTGNYIWEYDFERIPFIGFLVMDAETYLSHPDRECDSIRKYVPILKWYQVTLEDLERMNWTVTYPPSE